MLVISFQESFFHILKEVSDFYFAKQFLAVESTASLKFKYCSSLIHCDAKPRMTHVISNHVDFHHKRTTIFEKKSSFREPTYIPPPSQYTLSIYCSSNSLNRNGSLKKAKIRKIVHKEVPTPTTIGPSINGFNYPLRRSGTYANNNVLVFKPSIA